MIWKQAIISKSIPIPGTGIYSGIPDTMLQQIENPDSADGLFYIRPTHYSYMEDDTTGNEQRLTTRMYETPAPFPLIKDASIVIIDGNDYEVIEVVDMYPRWTTMRIRAHKL